MAGLCGRLAMGRATATADPYGMTNKKTNKGQATAATSTATAEVLIRGMIGLS
jgi:hypothetical protein